jgi:enterochelin esterase-like enzyme
MFAALARLGSRALDVVFPDGSEDPFRSADTRFAGILKEKGLPIQFHIWPGGHYQSYWQSHWAATWVSTQPRSKTAIASKVGPGEDGLWRYLSGK